MFGRVRDEVIKEVQAQADKTMEVAKIMIEHIKGSVKDKMHLERVIRGKEEELEAHKDDSESQKHRREIRNKVCNKLSEIGESLNTSKSKM
jgi:hypothetical protein